MNKQSLLREITETVKKKHPWKISQERYFNVFGRLPQQFLEERLAFDNLLEKMKKFSVCELVYIMNVQPQVRLSIDELIIWELSLDKWEEVRRHNIVPKDIKKLLKEIDNAPLA